MSENRAADPVLLSRLLMDQPQKNPNKPNHITSTTASTTNPDDGRISPQVPINDLCHGQMGRKLVI
ncbi:MAG: hypothetical protein COB40_12025 [Marinosulfonomonas sp.]|nr:MAG: hypothetical protein COB40_12025 [Marinosulfonomonas sp.]